ncbi:hypothetical protein QZH41_013013, partial [Actinostola sp. cb2023]
FSVLLWVTCITFNLYWNAIKNVRTEKFEKWYHLCSWGISLIMACLPLFGGHYGPAGAWCWIKRDTPYSTIWRMLMWYVPLFLIVIALFAVYGYIFIVYRRQARAWVGTYNAEDERNRDLMKKHVKPLMAYPCIYLATSIFPLAHRVYQASTSTPSFPLLLLHVISSPIVGALNAIVFGMDKETFSRLNWPQMKVAFAQHSRARKPLVREYPVGDATEVRPNDDSSWSTTSSDSHTNPQPPQDTEIPQGNTAASSSTQGNVGTNTKDD